MCAVPVAAAARVHELARQATRAGHGDKGALYRAAAVELGVSVQTLQRWIKESVVTPPRKRRCDAGTTALKLTEAKLLSALLMESHRKNGKRLMSVEQAVDVARANGLIRAEAVDADGVVRPLSVATITRALRAYGLHPDTLLRPAPAISLASRHPNHVWQIDASLCVLYYLRPSKDERQNGLRVMEADQFYKNKPGNLAKITQERVWRYAVTDHCSGHIYVEYVLGAESGENLCNVFINAMQRRPDEPVHGVPLMVMLDPGSANTGALFRNLCRSLSVRVQINQVGNPRAKGQVEQSHNLIETSFEGGLKFVRVDSLAALNSAAARWRRWFNGTPIHTRHGRTRYEAWMRIAAEQLRLAPELAICRELATTAPVERTVDDHLRVSFQGTEFDVAVVPDVQNGDKVLVCRNPWRPEAAQVVSVDADGREVFYVVEPAGRDEHGFVLGAPVIGEDYRRHADTPAQTAAKEIELLAMDETTQEAAAAARKGRRLPFRGEIDPWKHMQNGVDALPAYLPKRGTALDTPLPGVVTGRNGMDMPARLHVDAVRMNVVAAAARLTTMVPGWNADHYTRLAAGWPEGCLEDELDEVAAQLSGGPRLAACG